MNDTAIGFKDDDLETCMECNGEGEIMVYDSALERKLRGRDGLNRRAQRPGTIRPHEVFEGTNCRPASRATRGCEGMPAPAIYAHQRAGWLPERDVRRQRGNEVTQPRTRESLGLARRAFAPAFRVLEARMALALDRLTPSLRDIDRAAPLNPMCFDLLMTTL